MPEVCPSIFIIDPDKRTSPRNDKDIFYPDGFKVLQAERLTRIKEIISNTTTGQKLYIRLLCCYWMKDAEETYCTHRYVDKTDKRICSDSLGVKNKFTHFHIQGKMEDLRCSEYLLAFIEGSDFSNNAEILAKELICSIDWLNINSSEIIFNVFTYGEPIYGTSNENHLEELVNLAKNKINKKYIRCKITHIGKEREDFLLISLKDKNLFFNPSSKE